MSSGPPQASSAEVTARMRSQQRRDTAAELSLRRELWRRGLRYRVDQPLEQLPRRRADIVFRGAKLIVFVDGCFWHCCPQHGTRPAHNGEWWAKKLDGNVARDRDTDTRLREHGWEIVRVWEHEDPLAAADRVEKAVRHRLSPALPPPS